MSPRLLFKREACLCLADIIHKGAAYETHPASLDVPAFLPLRADQTLCVTLYDYFYLHPGLLKRLLS